MTLFLFFFYSAFFWVEFRDFSLKLNVWYMKLQQCGWWLCSSPRDNSIRYERKQVIPDDISFTVWEEFVRWCGLWQRSFAFSCNFETGFTFFFRETSIRNLHSSSFIPVTHPLIISQAHIFMQSATTSSKFDCYLLRFNIQDTKISCQTILRQNCNEFDKHNLIASHIWVQCN